MALSVSNTAFLVGNGFSADGQNPVEMLSAAYRRTRQPAVDKLQTTQDTLTKRQVFFNSLRSRLESLHTTVTSFTESGSSSKFSTRKATVSDATVATASVTADAVSGTSSLKVTRLATNDTMLSDSITLATKFDDNLSLRNVTPLPTTGPQSFTVGGRSYSILYDSTSDTNETVMTKIATAINADTSATVSANLIKDTSTTGRMSFVSKSTGAEGVVTFDAGSSMLQGLGLGSAVAQQSSTSSVTATGQYLDRNATAPLAAGVYSFSINGVTTSVALGANTRNRDAMDSIISAIQGASIPGVSSATQQSGPSSRLSITNSIPGSSLSIVDSDGLLAYMGIPTQVVDAERTRATSTTAGYSTSSESKLNSTVEVNGVTVSRSSNTLSDVLPGMTINLLKTQSATDSAVTLSVAKDTDAISSSIQPILDGFNEALKYLQANVKTVAGNDPGIRSLMTQLRGIGSSLLGSPTSDAKYLADVGIKIDKDGLLSISDKDKLKNMLISSGPDVERLISGTTGLAATIKNTIGSYTGTEGLAGERSKLLGTQIASTKDRITKLKARIDQEVDLQVKDYKKLQESFYKLQEQMSKYTSFGMQY